MANRMIHTPGWLAASNLEEYWTTVVGTWAISGGYYTRGGGTNCTLRRTFDSQTGWTIGCQFKYTGTSGNNLCFELLDGTTQHSNLWFNASTGVFSVQRGATLIQTGTTVLNSNTEYYVEWQSVIADSPNGVSILKVDNVVDSGINSSALDTRNAGNASANIVGMAANSSTLQFYRNIYINDNSGGVDDTFWTPITVATLTASGTGNYSQWTPLSSTNVSNVDDTTPDGDTSYNATSTNGQIDTFAMTNTGYSSGTVKGVETALEVRRTDASSSARVAPLWRISSTDYVGTDAIPTTTYLLKTQQYRQSPATSSAWTLSELDGAELGYKRTAS